MNEKSVQFNKIMSWYVAFACFCLFLWDHRFIHKPKAVPMRCINANEVVPSRVYATPCPSAENSCTQPAMLGRLHVPWPAMTNPEFRSSLLTWISVHCDRWKGCKLIREGLPCITCIYQKHSKAASDKGLPFSPPANKQEDCKPTSTVHTAYYSFMVTVLPKNQVRVCTHENPSLCKCTLSVALESSNCPGSCKPACSSERDAFCSCLMNVLRAIEVHKRQKKLQKQEGIHKQAAEPCCAADASVEVHLHSLRAKPLSSRQLPSSLTAQSKPTYAIPCTTCSTSWFDLESLSKPGLFFRKLIHNIELGAVLIWKLTSLQAKLRSNETMSEDASVLQPRYGKDVLSSRKIKT